MRDIEGRDLYVVDEVVHFGGFFQGDTVGLKAHPIGDVAPRRTLTIDDSAWENLRDKYELAVGAVLLLRFHLGEVAEAAVLGHPDREQLRKSIRERDISPNRAVRAIAYHCRSCNLWVAREPERVGERAYACVLCHTPLAGG